MKDFKFQVIISVKGNIWYVFLNINFVGRNVVLKRNCFKYVRGDMNNVRDSMNSMREGINNVRRCTKNVKRV